MMGFEGVPALTLSGDATEDSVLYALPLARFQTLFSLDELRPAVAQLINQWLDRLFYGLSGNDSFPNRQAEVLVQAGERLILRKGEAIASQRYVVWGKMKADKLKTLKINGLGKINASNEEGWMPLGRRAFWESDRNLGLRFYPTEEALQHPAAWRSLRLIEQLLLDLEQQDIEERLHREEARLRQKYTLQNQQAARSLHEAQSILNPQKADKYAQFLDQHAENTLFQAAQVVARASGIRLQDNLHQNPTDPLGDIARASRLRFREVKLEGKWWKQEIGPLLGFEEVSGAPVAFIPVGRAGYEAYNPANRQTMRLDAKQAAQFSPLAYTFFRPLPPEPVHLWGLLRFGLFQGQADFWNLLLMGLSGAVLGLVTPVLTGILFDQVIPNASPGQVGQLGLALLVATLASLLLRVSEQFALLRLETRLDLRLQAAIWDRVLQLPTRFFRQFSGGDLANRTLGVQEIRRLLSGVVVASVLGGIFSLVNFVLLFYYSASLALVALSLVLLECLAFYVLGRPQIKYEQEALHHTGQAQGLVLQLLTGISKFKVTGTEIRAFIRWLDVFRLARQAQYRAATWQNQQALLNALAPVLFNAFIFAFLFQINGGPQLSTGSFLAFQAAFGALTAALLSLSEALLTVFQVMPLYKRTRPILEARPETDEGKKDPGLLRGKVEISDVQFRYEANGPLIFQGISFRLDPGDYVALVGPSGSGKSTLVRLLLGFESPTAGSIFYDDQDLGQLDLRRVRRQIGTVLQNGQLVPGDIFSNIVGTSPHLRLEDAWEAARLAALDEDIKKMPMGMHTVIGEGSTTLSGGQKQRLLIARTLVHKPRLLIFDEATSALDNQTQAIVTQSLRKLQATRIVIAHRLSTIREVDKILVIDQGQVVQQGTYEALMAVEGPFKALARRQME
ncbi:MAG: NHLP bacteriocin export ABC transporter permease/ATPase subunit [Microscillaceae bacterium]|nr:NHLP bacteriocin export ABC transporter permease/ATPase subunit [Microscillaceae bacterium]